MFAIYKAKKAARGSQFPRDLQMLPKGPSFLGGKYSFFIRADTTAVNYCKESFKCNHFGKGRSLAMWFLMQE